MSESELNKNKFFSLIITNLRFYNNAKMARYINDTFDGISKEFSHNKQLFPTNDFSVI